MNIKKYILLITLFLSPLFSDELKQISLQLQWKYQFQFAGFIMAKEKGFYKEEGLDVNIKEWKDGIDMVNETVFEKSEYAIARPTSLIDISKGAKIYFLAAIYQSSPLVILADKKSGIKTLEDFKNKRLMSTGDLNSDASLLSMMFSQGVNRNNITMQKPSFNVKDLLNNKTDLLAAYISNEPFVLKELGGEPIIFNPKDYGFDFYNDILITSKNYLNKNPKEVENFTYASLKGWEYAFSNIEETVDIILKKYNTQNKSRNALLYEATELKKLAYNQTNKIGVLDKRKIERIYDVYKLLGLAKGNINFDKIIYNFSPLNLSIEEKNYLKNKKSVTMCIDPNWMPFEKFEDNKHIGLSAQYFKIFSEKLNIKFKVIPTNTWEESLSFAKNRVCDILSLAAQTPSREKWFNFTTPYLKLPLVIVTKLNVPFINDISTLKNKKLGIPKGYAFAEIMRDKYPYLNIVDVKDIDDGLKKVNNGELFGYLGTIATIEYTFQNKYFDELKIAAKIDEVSEHGVAVRKDDFLLLSVLNKTIESLNAEQKQNILNKWVSITYKKQTDYSLILGILIISSILIIFFLYKQFFLKKSIKEFHELIDATMEGLIISKNSICVDVNQSALDILGFDSKKDMIGKHILEFVSSESKNNVAKYLKIDISSPYEAIIKREDGSKFFALVKGYTIKNKKLRISSFIDISQLKNQEKMLIEQSKMAALGEMLSNIAHQWRQPLAAISASSTGMILQKEHNILSDESFFSSCTAINNYAQYLSKTIDDFKNYAKGDTQSKEFNLKNETEKFLILVDSIIKQHNIKVDLISDEEILINGFQNELIQCFINLFYNSKDVFIHKNQEKKYIQIIQKADKNFVTIIFRDNGGGILEEALKKIFEPYFTTKHKSQGTGLGLHMTYNLIVNSMKGTISARNVNFPYEKEIFQGAEFTIILPLNH
ncbi:ABC transporter substrate-binding protein [Arcobacter sp.]|uniref:ABC transporter substrate-binding protein n=1 Tax=Arcobacter sp. TaxID=1872629 RepID=UPI003D151C06